VTQGGATRLHFVKFLVLGENLKIAPPLTELHVKTAACASHNAGGNKLSPRGRRDDMPPPMTVRLAADIHRVAVT